MTRRELIRSIQAMCPYADRFELEFLSSCGSVEELTEANEVDGHGRYRAFDFRNDPTFNDGAVTDCIDGILWNFRNYFSGDGCAGRVSFQLDNGGAIVVSIGRREFVWDTVASVPLEENEPVEKFVLP